MYDYSLAASVDDYPLSSDNAAVFPSRTAYPLPSSLWLERLRLSGGPTNFSRMPFSEQSLVIPVELSSVIFKKKWVYDPDISITLLFTPQDDALPPDNFSDAASTSTTVVVVVAVVVVVVVIAASVTLFAFVIWPYMKRRKQASSEEGILEENPEQPEKNSAWKAVRPSRD